MPQELRDRIAAIAELRSVDDLNALLVDVRAWYAEQRNADDAAEHRDELREAVAAAASISDRIVEVQTEDAAIAAELAAMDEQMSDPDPEPEEEAEPAEEAEEEAPADPEPEAEDIVDPEPELVPAAAAPAAKPARATVAAAAALVPAEAAPRPSTPPANRIVAVQGGMVGQEITDGWKGIGARAASVMRAMHGTSGNGEKIAVAKLLGDYEPERMLDVHDATGNMAKINAIGAGDVDALVAAGGFCAPASPYYGMAVVEDDSRPVRAGLQNFAAARGSVSLILPDQIGDFDTATDEWTEADDEAVTDSSATWKPVQEITCGSTTTYTLRAVTKILQFGNFDARTHPEKVDAVMAKAAANHARLAEQLLLDDIKTQSVVTNANGMVGVARDTLVRVGQAAAGYRNRNRMPLEATLDFYAPGWLRDAMQADLALAAPGDVTIDDALAEIEGYLRLRNVNPIWYMDGPSTGHNQYFSAQTGGTAQSTLNAFPSYVQWGLHHQGAFLFLDGGELDLGVVRDSTLNRKNAYQVFAETFEKAAFVGVEALWVTQLVDISGGSGGTEDQGS